ncbi:hypothetical protein F5B17DRAFT_434562 [Nemania serpens]|nr:hypothetical protein F5B17DRAFT_434562 [Nemania serpens]
MAAPNDPRTEFGLSCPSGGAFYICADAPTRFIGCCGVDPCSHAFGGECPRTQLFDASFSASSSGDILAQGSMTPEGDNRGGYGLWYICANMHPPFLGCCSNDPCVWKSCLDGNLVPAVMSGDERNASQFEVPGTMTSASPAGGLVSSTTDSSTPVNRGQLLDGNSQRTPHDTDGRLLSPVISDSFHSPHHSQLSELEGNSEVISALHPKSSVAR